MKKNILPLLVTGYAFFSILGLSLLLDCIEILAPALRFGKSDEVMFGIINLIGAISSFAFVIWGLYVTRNEDRLTKPKQRILQAMFDLIISANPKLIKIAEITCKTYVLLFAFCSLFLSTQFFDKVCLVAPYGFELIGRYELAEKVYKFSHPVSNDSFVWIAGHCENTIYGVKPQNPKFDEVIIKTYGYVSLQNVERLESLGWYRTKNGEFDLGISNIEESRTLAKRLLHNGWQLMAIDDLSCRYLEKGEKSKIKELLNEALNIIEKDKSHLCLHFAGTLKRFAKETGDADLVKAFDKLASKDTCLRGAMEQSNPVYSLTLLFMLFLGSLFSGCLIGLYIRKRIDAWFERTFEDWRKHIDSPDISVSLDFLHRIIIFELYRGRYEVAHDYSQRFLSLVNKHAESAYE